ncbi:MAG: hypothetical protein BWY31_04196 [Lentisphaerae bacterium ADurb.Bin242]|nr:MAG: hypothetical protein BWY31_04196 [Lentisphaerae bacterium ADurb.Bin242]
MAEGWELPLFPASAIGSYLRTFETRMAEYFGRPLNGFCFAEKESQGACRHPDDEFGMVWRKRLYLIPDIAYYFPMLRIRNP